MFRALWSYRHAPVVWPSRGPTLLLVPPLRTVRESFQLTRLKFPGTLKS
jgi:hypothetical protein